MNYESTFKQINQNIQAAEAHLAKIQAAMEALENAGIYPAIPQENWKNNRYLYLKFQSNRSFDGLDLDKKNRLYIGCKVERVEDARRLVRNTQHHQRLRKTARQLTIWLSETDRAITNLTRRAEEVRICWINKKL